MMPTSNNLLPLHADGHWMYRFSIALSRVVHLLNHRIILSGKGPFTQNTNPTSPLKAEPLSTQHYYCTTESRLWTLLLSKQLAQPLPLGRPGSTDRFSLISMSIQDTKYEEMLLPCTCAAPLPPEAVLSPGCGLLWLPTCLEEIPLRRKEMFSQMIVFPPQLSASTIFPSICCVSQELMASSRCKSVVTTGRKGRVLV